jgi:hypothetical protein
LTRDSSYTEVAVTHDSASTAAQVRSWQGVD